MKHKKAKSGRVIIQEGDIVSLEARVSSVTGRNKIFVVIDGVSEAYDTPSEIDEKFVKFVRRPLVVGLKVRCGGEKREGEVIGVYKDLVWVEFVGSPHETFLLDEVEAA